MIKNILFDVDGTLWDSAARVGECWTAVLQEYPETRGMMQSKEDIYRYMGHTMDDIARQMMPQVSEPKRSEIMNRCMEEENAYLRLHSGVFYTGLSDTLYTLRELGYRLFIVSNCQIGYIETLLRCGSYSVAKLYGNVNDDTLSTDAFCTDAFSGNTPYADTLFTDIECYGHTKKPKGENCRLLMERNALLPEETIYVGDTRMDEAAAEKAGIRFIHAAYGFGEAEHPAAVLSDIAELISAIKNL